MSDKPVRSLKELGVSEETEKKMWEFFLKTSVPRLIAMEKGREEDEKRKGS